MPIICCWNEQVSQLSAEQVSIEGCAFHNKPIEFICTQPECEKQNDLLLCKQCLKQHKNHKWINKQQYFSLSMRNILHNHPKPNITNQLNQIRQTVHNALQQQIVDVFNQKIQEIQQQFQLSLQTILQKNQLRRTQQGSNGKLTREVMPEIKQLYEQEKQDTAKIKQISNILQQSVKHAGIVINSILKLLLYEVDSHLWHDQREMNDLKDELEKYSESKQAKMEEKFFEFSKTTTHECIRLQEDNKQAVYINSSPSHPVSIANQSFSQSHSKFGFQIVHMQSLAFFFQITTIFLGICNPNIVKVAGMRKISEPSKGAYLISSAGWSYHHKDPKYDRQENVGFTFAEGDKIEIEVIFDPTSKNDQTKVVFTKKNRFFDSSFEMPLKLTNDQVKKLKPCVSFSAEEGAIVRIYDAV